MPGRSLAGSRSTAPTPALDEISASLYNRLVSLPRFGLNRFDARSVDLFAADVRRAEALGWDATFQPDSQLRRRDTYVLLAAAARATERVTLGPLLANPINRHPTVTASNRDSWYISTVESTVATISDNPSRLSF